MLMQNVVRMADRFLDGRNPDALDRQQRLFACIALVGVFHIMLSIAFVKFQQLEKRHHIRHIDPDVQFELMIAPPTPKHIDSMPPPTSLVDKGKTDIGGSAEAKPNTEKLDLTKTEAPKKEEIKPTNQHFTVADPPPLNVVSTNPIKKVVTPLPVSGDDHPTAGVNKDNALGDEDKGQGGGGQLGDTPGSGVGPGKIASIAGGELLDPGTKGRALGNISPYRTHMLGEIAKVCRGFKKGDMVVVLIRIAQDGTLIESEAVQYTSKRAANHALEIVEGVTYDHLPEWYQGDDLTFQVTFAAGAVEVK